MRKSVIKDKLSHSKRQLCEYQKLRTPYERFEAYRRLLKPAISRIYEVVMADTNFEYAEIEHLKRDYLHLDVECIPFYSDEAGTISFIRYADAQELKFPEGEYSVIDEKCGMYKIDGNEKVLFSKRIAIDHTLIAFASIWYNRIPELMELFGINVTDAKQ